MILGSASAAECFPCLFAVVIIGGVVALVMWFAQAAKAQWAAAAQIARRWHAVFYDGGWGARHSIGLNMQGAPGYLTGHPSGKNTPALTRLDLQLALPFRLRLTPQDFFLGLRKFFGAQDLEIGDAAFDESFQIESNSVATAKRILTPDLRKLILRLRSVFVTLDVRPNGVSIAVRRYFIPSAGDLASFLEISDRVIAALKEQVGTAGVSIVEIKTEQGNCLTCGTPLATAFVACAKCKTRQHRDCWDYAGGCSVYACGSRDFLVPRSKPA